MKIAVGVTNKESKELNEMFARSPLFAIVEINGSKLLSEEFKENHFAGQMSGAGTAVIEELTKAGVEAVICANLGPKALDLSKQLGIKAYKSESLNYEETLKKFLDGNLSEIK